jgi:hypothetical protein
MDRTPDLELALACYVLKDTSKKEGKNLIVHSMLQSKSISIQLYNL